MFVYFFFFQAEDGIRDATVTGVQTCALPIYLLRRELEAPCDLFEVRPLVHDGDSVQPARLRHRRSLGCEPLDGRAQRIVGCLVGIEMHGDAGVPRDSLAHVASLLQRGSKRDGPSVQGRVEPRAQLGQQRSVTQWVDSYSSRSWRRAGGGWRRHMRLDRKSTRLNS